MNAGIIIPIFIGAATILQGSLNKQMSSDIGLAQSVLLGNTLIVLFSIALYFYVLKYPETFPSFFHIKAHLLTFKWWYIFPALFGFSIVLGIPYAYFKLGAVKVTVLMIAAQMVVSILWDYFIEKAPVNTSKGLGLLFGILSVFFTIR